MSKSDSYSEIDQVIRRWGLICDWHKDISSELDQCTKQADDIFAETNRTDLSELAFITIDGVDAKDFDDAIYCQESGEDIILWVAIADVASYVRVGSVLDREAFKRGNSTYLPDRVLPMLPPLLSDNLCSLRPHEDRPVIVCRMVFDRQAKMSEYRFSKALIRSRCRLTYREVHVFFRSIAEGAAATCGSAQVSSMLGIAQRLFEAMRKLRAERGALDLDIPQKRLRFDKNRCIEAVTSVSRNDAHRMIEEFMICANVAAAHYLSTQDISFLSRVHEGIKSEMLPILDNFLRGLGFRLRGTKVSDIARLIEQTSQHSYKPIIHTMILSSLQRAIYTPSDKGHFGLALKHYTHFTSPIRRYPDLLVHRAIHATLGSASGHRYSSEELKSRGQHCSMTERRSDEAVWDIQQYFLCVLAQAKVGQTYRGIIAAVAAFGLFVELEELQTSGLLHVKYLRCDYYRFNQTYQYLKGVRHGKIYRVGERIKVMIKSVRPDERKIDLVPANL